MSARALRHGSRSSAISSLLSRAIQAFQEAQGLEPTGILDDATREALERAYGA